MGASLGVSLLLITVAPHGEAAQVLIALSGEQLPPCPNENVVSGWHETRM